MKPVIYFLHHSGFLVEMESMILVFDYYMDPAGQVEKLMKSTDKPFYFFASHVHGDHFNPALPVLRTEPGGILSIGTAGCFLGIHLSSTPWTWGIR